MTRPTIPAGLMLMADLGDSGIDARVTFDADRGAFQIETDDAGAARLSELLQRSKEVEDLVRRIAAAVSEPDPT